MGQPNFFIVGAARSGTTALWIYLNQHPAIFLPEGWDNKEPAYFCNHYGMNDWPEYLKLFSKATDRQVIGEASTAYLAAPESASLIHDKYPDAKIIVMLRNPVERAYSLYRWMVSHGYEWVYPFENALDVEISRKDDKQFFLSNPENFYNYMYFHSGLYSEQLKRYYNVFPERQVKVCLLDDMKEKPVETVQDIFAFLGVDDKLVPEIKVHNSAELRPVSASIHFAIKSFRWKHRHTRLDTAAGVFSWLNLEMLGLKWPRLDQSTRNSLQERYRSNILETQRLIHRDLSHWLV